MNLLDEKLSFEFKLFQQYMKGASPFDQSQKASNPSKQLFSSPSKQLQPSSSRNQLSSPKNRQDQELPTEMQYRLEKVFEQARSREQRYIAIIKQQEQKLKVKGQDYLSTLREIKTQFIDFMQLKKAKKDKKWTINHLEDRDSKKELYRLNSQEFTVKRIKQLVLKINSQNTKMEPSLYCKMTFYYYTPHLKDYFRQVVPEEMILRLRSIHSGKQFEQEIKLVKDQDEANNINYLAQRIPFEITTPQNTAIVMDFEIPCRQQAINFYKQREFQVQILNKRGMFVYACSKLSPSSLLYYQDQPTEWKLKPIQFFSALDGVKVGTMSFKLSNELKMAEKDQHYKIQSNNPMQVNDYKSYMNYTDDQSRMIHRISKFKTAHNSLLLGVGSVRDANAQRYFENQNDKIILMHKKKKELQSIQQYKNIHKEQLMDKLFADAINRYYLLECQLGKPTFVVFNYFNSQKEHKKIYVRTNVKMHTKDPEIGVAALEEGLSVSVVHPTHFQTLISRKIIEIGSQMHYQYNMQEQEQSLWTMSGMSHPIVVRLISFPPKQTHINKQTLSQTYELSLVIKDEYDREIQTFHQKVKLVEPNPQHRLYFHGYSNTKTQFQIPFDEPEDQVVPKNMITNHQDVAYNWDEKWTALSLNVKHGQPGEKTFFVMVNDGDQLYQINCYQVMLFTYPKLSHKIRLAMGEVQKIKMDFSFDQATLTQKNKSIEKEHQKSRKARQEVRVLFASSKPEHCFVRCHNQTELVCKMNKIYEVQARLQSFEETIDPEHLDTNRVLRRWLIQIQKEKTKYQQIHKLVIQHSKPLKYRLQFCNREPTQHSYRLYSSNISIMTVPLDVLSLMSNQLVNIDLAFDVKHQLTNSELAQPLRITLSITNGQQFINHLFLLTLKMH